MQSQKKHGVQHEKQKIKEKRYKHCHWLKSVIQLTNATVVDDAIRFVSDKSKGKIESGNSNENNKELRESDYDEDGDQLEEEKQEEEAGETTAATINQVF